MLFCRRRRESRGKRRGHDNVRSGLALVGDGIPFSELRLSEVRNISGEKQHVRTRARQAQCAHLTVDRLIDLMESPTG
jgi:hypothetical protein